VPAPSTENALMRLRDIYADSFGLSFEIFPPKTEAGDAALERVLERLSQYNPGFISCTYGAGGSTQSRTVDLCKMIQEKFHQTAMSHFTCVGSTRDELVAWLKQADAAGIRNIMALRGDPPQGQETFKAVEGGLSYANELVELIRGDYPDIGIGVAGYPETHQEAPDFKTDVDNLIRKIEAGADAVITQLFYVNENYFRFCDELDRRGVTIPVVPGIMPITSFARIKRITAMCAAIFPEELSSRLEAVQDNDAAQFEIGVEHAIQQCQALIDRGAPGIHFYVLNKSEACERILDSLSLAGHNIAPTAP